MNDFPRWNSRFILAELTLASLAPYNLATNSSIVPMFSSTTSREGLEDERALRVAVRDGKSIQADQAIFFPFPKNDDVVSHPVSA